MTDQPTEHVLYRFYDAAEQLLYVGITLNVTRRMAAHRESKPWWPEVAAIRLARYDSRAELEAAERAAIKAEGPLHNGTHALLPVPAPRPPAVVFDHPDLEAMTTEEVVAYARERIADYADEQRERRAHLARVLNRAHDEYGMTWARIARGIGVDASTVYRWAAAV